MQRVKDILSTGFLAAFKSDSTLTPTGVSATNFWDSAEVEIFSKYGNMRASALLEYMDEGGALTTSLNAYLSSRYLNKWRRVLSTLESDYDPVYNVDELTTITHSGTDTHNAGTTATRTDNLTDELTHGHTNTRTHADSDTRTHANTDTQTLNNSDTTTFADTKTQTLNNSDTVTNGKTTTNTHEISGDNGGLATSGKDTAVNTGNDVTAHSGTIADAHTGTITDAHSGTIADAHTGTITDAHTGTITDAESGKDTRTNTGTQATAYSGADTDVWGHKITTERAGNIGTVSASDLVKQELEMRNAYNYFDIVCRDVKQVVCGYDWGSYDD